MENNFDACVFGIQFNSNNVKPLDTLFDLKYESDEEIHYVSKKTYVHEDDDDLNFKYKYVIEGYKCGGCGEKVFKGFNLYLVPCFESLCDKAKKHLLDSCGLETLDDDDVIEAIYYGYGVLMGSAGKEYEDWDSAGEFDTDDMAKIAFCCEIIDRMRGFYLDKPQNRLGSDGWDTLKDCVLGIDRFARILGR